MLSNFLTIQVILTDIPRYKKDQYRVTLYDPYYVARQMDFCQALATPFPSKTPPLCKINFNRKKGIDKCLDHNDYYSRSDRSLENIFKGLVKSFPDSLEMLTSKTSKRKTEPSKHQKDKKILKVSKVSQTNKVVDELMAEFADLGNSGLSPDKQQYDEKNIHRRVYDALNILMTMDIISKDKREIQWKGFLRTRMNDIEELKICRQPQVLLFLSK
ncbi:uncharacterized protein LOC110278705 [Arachis duranensis]|uniref:Uncharacterized protein LOC110278705 n=1 Tax=Arachis duranensis TaxID=130453 RepID=A0A6P5N6X0_ARADU|nr:uncharacterized protein LOC110278705 [Arachis duranensis]